MKGKGKKKGKEKMLPFTCLLVSTASLFDPNTFLSMSLLESPLQSQYILYAPFPPRAYKFLPL